MKIAVDYRAFLLSCFLSYIFEIVCNEKFNTTAYDLIFKELAEQLKAQLKEANKFKETQMPAKRLGVEVSNKSLFDYVYYYFV